MKISIDLNDQATAALAAAPESMRASIGQALERSAMELQRAARRRADASARSGQLRNSISIGKVDDFTYEVGPTAAYGPWVEQGTKAGYMPNPVHLYSWIKARAGISFRSTKKGSTTRRAQYDAIRDGAWALAMHIKKHGTQPRPFMAPAADEMQGRITQLLQAGVERGIAAAAQQGGAA